jgi:hypothetical protein
MSGSVQKRKRLVVFGALCLILVLVGLFWFRNHLHRRAILHRVEEMTARLTGEPSERAPGSDRRARWNEWHFEIERLSPDLRHEFWARRRADFHAWLRDLMKASQREQAALLAEIIERIKDFRTQWDKLSGGEPGWWHDLSSLELEKRQQQWLSMAGPEERALVNEFLRMLAAQALQDGLAAVPSPWGDDAPT